MNLTMGRVGVGVLSVLCAVGCDSGATSPADAAPADVVTAADMPTADAPSLIDAPAVDAPVVDAPVVDVPVVDAPVVDAPVIDAPVIDVPAVDVPAVDVPDVLDVPVFTDVPVAMDAPACLLSSATSGVRPVRVQEFGMSANLAGLDVAAMPCGISVLTTTADTTGSPRARYLLGQPFWLRMRGVGFVDAYTGEFNTTGDGFGFEGRESVRMFSTASVRTYFPGFDASKAHLLVDVRTDTGSSCVPPTTGFTVSVADHPEARVIYWRGNVPTPSATSSEQFGRISIENLTPGAPVTIVARGGTCILSPPALSGSGYTGRYPIAANTITVAVSRTIAAPPDADAGTSDAGVTMGGDAAACTTTTVAAGGTALTVWPPISRPLGDIGVAWIGCGAPLTTSTNASGIFALSVPQSMSGYFRNTRSTAYPTLSGELLLPITAAVPLFLWETAATDALSGAWLPGYDPARAHVFIDINDTLGGCLKTGFVPTIPGHPEAVVRYIGGTAGVSSSLTSTSAYGRMVITGLTPGGFVTPAATNGTCHLNFARIFQTGRVSLEAGSVTVLQSRAEP